MKTAAAIVLGLIPLVVGADKYLLAVRRKNGYKMLKRDINAAYSRAKTVHSDLPEMFLGTVFLSFANNDCQINAGEFEKYGLDSSDTEMVSALINSIKRGDTAAVNDGFSAALSQISEKGEAAQEYLKTTAAMYLKVSLAVAAAVFLIII